jgi:nitrogen fixation/metabolism regulation signal transduction histidine kinase
MTPFWLTALLVLIGLLLAWLVVRGLRGGSRLQRRLFLIFLLLSFLPSALVMVVNWRLSQRQLELLDSPGLAASLESSLGLARRVWEREKTRALACADRCLEDAAGGAPEDLGDAVGEGSCRILLSGGGVREAGPLAGALAALDPRDFRRPELFVFDGASTIVAAREGEDGLALVAVPVAPDLHAELDAIRQGGSRFRQLRLYYGALLRGDTALTVAAVALVLMLASLLLSRWFARRIGGPVMELARGTEVVAAGDLDHRVEAEALDELGDLVTAFNRMTADLKASKDELIRAERIAAWQGIARRLAHEIKNPLTPIGLSMHRIRRKTDDPTVHECVDAVLEETENLRRLADEFSLYARLPAPALQPVDVGELLRGVVELYADREGIAVRWEGWPASAAAPVLVSADPGQLRQVLANLVKNAVEAVGSDGTLTLGLARSGPGRIAVSVADSGGGLPGDPERIFEPYFTTKESGTGLGLAIARKIVQDHGGRLAAAAATGGGAIFSVELPAAGDAATDGAGNGSGRAIDGAAGDAPGEEMP